jgi:hypothetical protein
MQILTEDQIATKDALLEGLSGSKRQIVGTLIENQMKHLMETAPATATTASAVSDFQRIVIPMIRRIIPGTIAADLVGVQPLTGPVGLVYSLRFAFAETVDTSAGSTAPSATNITAGDEMFINNSKMKRFYSSANVGTTGYPPALTAATSDGMAATTANYEGYGGRAVRLSVLKQTVTVGSRKLQARWTMEAAQDMNSTHGLDLESELTAALSTQIAHEIDNEILTDLLALASTVVTYDFSAPQSGFTPSFLGDRYAELGILVNKVANDIGARTKRGPGNWIVGSHLVTSMLQSATKSVFAPAVSGNFDTPIGNRFVGTLNGAIRVYTYNWGLSDAWDGFATTPTNTIMGATGEDILIGYKGGNSELDTGYFYCPYVPLMSTGVIMDANTFMPAISLMTRYGKATFTNAGTSFGNSSDYYARIRIMNVAFS